MLINHQMLTLQLQRRYILSKILKDTKKLKLSMNSIGMKSNSVQFLGESSHPDAPITLDHI